MKLKFLVMLIVSLGITGSVFGAPITSTAGGGNWSAPGSWVGGVVPGAADDVTIAATATISVDVNSACLTLTVNGNAVIDFPTNNRTLTVNGLMTMNGTSQVTGNNGTRVLSLLNDFIVPAGQQGSIGGISITQPVARNFTVSGTFSPIAPNNGTKNLGRLVMDQTGTWLASTNELYTFLGTGTFKDGCLVDGSATATILITGNLSVQAGIAGQHSRLSRISMTVNGITTITGYLEFANSAAGTKTFNNTITILPGGTWDDLVGEDPVINCSIVNNGSWPDPTGGTGSYRVNIAGPYTYSGSGAIGMTQLRVNSAATVTNTGTLRLTGAGTGNTAPLRMNSGGSTFINGDGTTGYLYFPASSDPVTINSGAVDFSPVSNTVEYSSSGNQNIYTDGVNPYYDLVTSNGANKFVVGATIVTNAMTITGTTTLDVSGGSDLTGTANLVMNGASTLRLSSAGTVPALTGAAHSLAAGTTIEFYRGGVQTAASSASYPYQNVLISGAGGSNVNMSSVTAIAGDLTINNLGLMNANAVLAINGLFTYASASASATILTNHITAGSFLGSSGLMNFSTNNKKLIIDGDLGSGLGLWENNGAAFSGVGPNVQFTTGVGQEIRGSTVTTFATLEINNTNDDVTLNGVDIIIGTALNFIAPGTRRLVTGIRNVIAGPAVPVTASTTRGWIDGNFRRLVNAIGSPVLSFPVGSSTVYSPVSLTVNAVTNTTGFFTMSSTDGDSPDIFSGLFDSNQTVNRYWSLRNSDAVTPAVVFTSVDATLNFSATDPDAGLTMAQASIGAYDNTALSWTTVVSPIVTFTATSASFTGFASANLLQDRLVDFQIGEKFTPQTVLNRRTNGTYNWSAADTWFQFRTGGITLDGTVNVVGTATIFTSELIVGEKLMLTSNVNTVYTVASITDDTHLTFTAAPGVFPLTTFGRQHIPGGNSPATDTDAVTIGSTLTPLTNTSATTITLDVTGYTILSLDINTSGAPIAQNQILTHSGSNAISILANINVNRPGAAGTDQWNINNGSATVQGDVTIGSNIADTNNTRIAQVNLTSGGTSGTLSAGNVKYRITAAGAGRELQAVLNMANNTVLTLSGASGINFNNLTRGGTLNSNAGAPGSTIIFNRAASSQTIVFPTTGGSSAWFFFNNLISKNTSANGLIINTNVTGATNVQGNIEVRTAGARLKLTGAITITGSGAKNFIVDPGASFELTNSGGSPFPTGYTFNLGTTAPFGNVYYNSNVSQNIDGTPTYGNLLIFNPAAAASRTFTLPNSTVVVAGNLTIDDGVSAAVPTLRGSGVSTVLDVRNNINIITGGILTAVNIPSIKVGGNWTNDGTFTISTGTVEFNNLSGAGIQTIGGNTASAFYNLTINTANTTDIVQLTQNASVSNVLTLTKGGLNLIDPGDVGRTLTISSNLTTAIVRTGGYIKGEKFISTVNAPFGTVTWNLGIANGNYVFPFGKTSLAADYIPFTLNKTGAGVGGTGFSVSTYGTGADNLPYPPTVSNLDGQANGLALGDRFWIITPNGYTTKPVADITLRIASGENPTGSPNLNAQRWNPALYWDAAFPVCGAGTCYTGSTPTAVTINAVTNFSPWTVTDVSIPLPIELTDFSAEFRSGMVALDWRTETELNNDFFMVQRTSDVENFEDVVQVKGAGTTATPKSYSTFDYQPKPGKWYYRLRQTDFDGTASYSKLVMVEITEGMAWSVFPNPSDGSQFTVNFMRDDLGKNAFIKLHDIEGRELLQLLTESLDSTQMKITFPQKLSSGFYIISIGVEKQVVRKKLIVK